MVNLMECSEFIKCIPDFIDKKLEEDYFDEFIQHAKSCESCKDELEIYYMIKVGLERIETDSSKSFDIQSDLENTLNYYEKRADILFKRSIYCRITCILSQICVSILLILQIIMLLK